jgi:hypothetical protein
VVVVGAGGFESEGVLVDMVGGMRGSGLTERVWKKARDEEVVYEVKLKWLWYH